MKIFDAHHSKIYLAPSLIPDAEYGVFAKHSLRAGELIELAPFVEVPQDIIFSLPNKLQEYAFKSHLHSNRAILILGYGSMYNHQPRPNVKYVPYKGDPNRFIAFYMLKDTPANTELYVHYGRDPITKVKCKPVLD